MRRHTLVIHVSDKQRFGGECVRLDIDIGTSDFVHKRTFPNVGVTGKNKCPGINLNSWKTSEMLSDLVKIRQRIFLALNDPCHSDIKRSMMCVPSQSGTL